jgi:hypothetical protein
VDFTRKRKDMATKKEPPRYRLEFKVRVAVQTAWDHKTLVLEDSTTGGLASMSELLIKLAELEDSIPQEIRRRLRREITAAEAAEQASDG